MRSSTAAEPAADEPEPDHEIQTEAEQADGDLTARARIRDAAITRFARDGVAGTSVRAIAAEAGVSPALVIHHFGSKDALRVACDRHVVSRVREGKSAAMAQGPGLDPVAALREQGAGSPLLAYLARTLVDGSPHVADLVDEMAADAVDYMAEGERTGLLRPAEDPRGRAVVLTLWTLGALVLHQHARRLLDVDLTAAPEEASAYFLPASELLGKGVLTEEAYASLREALQHAREGEA